MMYKQEPDVDQIVNVSFSCQSQSRRHNDDSSWTEMTSTSIKNDAARLLEIEIEHENEVFLLKREKLLLQEEQRRLDEDRRQRQADADLSKLTKEHERMQQLKKKKLIRLLEGELYATGFQSDFKKCQLKDDFHKKRRIETITGENGGRGNRKCLSPVILNQNHQNSASMSYKPPLSESNSCSLLVSIPNTRAETFQHHPSEISRRAGVDSPSSYTDSGSSASQSQSYMQSLTSSTIATVDSTRQEDNSALINWMTELTNRKLYKDELQEFSGDPKEWIMFLSQYEITSKLCGYSNAENLDRLRKCLKGKARKVVDIGPIMPDNVGMVIETLQQCFGRPDQIMTAYINDAKNSKAPTLENPGSLMEFYYAVHNLVGTAEHLNCEAYLNCPFLLDDLVSKLPTILKYQWGAVAFEKYTSTAAGNMPEANIKDLSDWLKRVAHAASYITPYDTSESSRSRSRPQDQDHYHDKMTRQRKHSDNGRVVVANENKTRRTNGRCVLCGNSKHKLENCVDFINSNISSRWNLVSELNLCFICLKPGHHSSSCHMKQRCGIDGCSKTHHLMLHKF